jgi:hypothetical protein
MKKGARFKKGNMTKASKFKVGQRIQTTIVIDHNDDSQIAMLNQLTAITAERDSLRTALELYKEAYTMACSRVKLYSQKHDRDWEAHHLNAARTALKEKP